MRAISVTARHVCGFDGILESNGTQIAKVSKKPLSSRTMVFGQTSHKYTSADSLLGLTLIDEGARYSGGPFVFAAGGHLEIKPPKSPSELTFAEILLVHVVGGDPKPAKISSTNAYFRMPQPETFDIATFGGAIEIRGVDDDPLTQKGDIGSLVTSKDGSAVGIVVCTIENATFVAPVDRVFKQVDGLVVMNHEMAESVTQYITTNECIFEEDPAASQDISDEELNRLKSAIERDDLDEEIALSSIIESGFF